MLLAVLSLNTYTGHVDPGRDVVVCNGLTNQCTHHIEVTLFSVKYCPHHNYFK